VEWVEAKPRLSEVGEPLIEHNGVVLAEQINPLATGKTESLGDECSSRPSATESFVNGQIGQEGRQLATLPLSRAMTVVTSWGRQHADSPPRVVGKGGRTFRNAQSKDAIEVLSSTKGTISAMARSCHG
jgi:hypothetical protein